MGFATGKYAKVWKVEDKGKYSVAEMSTSKKNKQTGEYETDWSDKFVRLIGDAHTAIQKLGSGARIKIGDCDVTNKYDKEKKQTYTNYAIFSLEDANGGSKPQSKPQQTTEDLNDELPF